MKDDFCSPYSWTLYSKKLREKILNPRAVGRFSSEIAKQQGMCVAIGQAGDVEDGNAIVLYLLVDEEDGQVVDAKFQVFGQSALIGAAESFCLLAPQKTYDQVGRISADLLDKQLRDPTDVEAFPIETRGHLNLVIEAAENAIQECSHIPLKGVVTPVPRDIGTKEESLYPDWITFSKEKKIEAIETVLAEEVRPYVELDNGGIEIHSLSDKNELTISYKGACTSCYSSIGTTLSTIQSILQAKIDPVITVVPNLDDLQL